MPRFSRPPCRRPLAERGAIAAESKLKLECIQKESDARVAAAVAAAAAATPVARAHNVKDDEILGEISSEVSDLSLRFAGLPQEEIIRIFHNKFKPINLYRLRHMRELCYETFQDEERIGIEDGMLRLRKTSGSYKDFGREFMMYGLSFSLSTLLSWFRYLEKPLLNSMPV